MSHSTLKNDKNQQILKFQQNEEAINHTEKKGECWKNMELIYDNGYIYITCASHHYYQQSQE